MVCFFIIELEVIKYLSNKVQLCLEMARISNEIKKIKYYTVGTTIIYSLLVLLLIVLQPKRYEFNIFFLLLISFNYGSVSLILYINKIKKIANDLNYSLKSCYNCGSLLRTQRGKRCQECDYEFPINELT